MSLYDYREVQSFLLMFYTFRSSQQTSCLFPLSLVKDAKSTLKRNVAPSIVQMDLTWLLENRKGTCSNYLHLIMLLSLLNHPGHLQWSFDINALNT